MLCLPTVKKIGFSNDVVARCEFRILGMEVRQQAGESWLLAPSPSFPTPDSILHYQGSCVLMWTLQATRLSSG